MGFVGCSLKRLSAVVVLAAALVTPTMVAAPSPAGADTMLKVPAFSQSDYPGDLGYVPNEFAECGCGVTSIAMVFRHYGLATDPRKVNDALRTVGDWKSIDEDLASGRPVMVYVASCHFVVIVGKKGGQYCINDPGNGARQYQPVSP